MTTSRTILGVTVALAAALAFSCSIEAELPREVDGDDPYRDGGCGSGREPGKGTQQCTYTAKAEHWTSYISFVAKGTCIEGDSDHIKCEYSMKAHSNPPDWCYWSSSSNVTGCAAPSPNAQYPACNDYPTPDGTKNNGATITFTKPLEVTENVPEGVTICDPPQAQAKLDDYCRINLTAETRKKIIGTCTDLKPETKSKEIDCCVKKGQKCGADGDTGAYEAGPYADAVEEEECELETTGDLETTFAEDDDGDGGWPVDLGTPEPIPTPE
jgi:hypothetical protein